MVFNSGAREKARAKRIEPYNYNYNYHCTVVLYRHRSRRL